MDPGALFTPSLASHDITPASSESRLFWAGSLASPHDRLHQARLSVMARDHIGVGFVRAAIGLAALGFMAAGCGGGGGGSDGGGTTPTRTATPLATSTPPPTGVTATPTPGGPATLTPTPTETPADLCGNGVIDEDENEECDRSALGGATCKSLDYDGGTLTCDDDCLFDEDGCFFEE